MGGIAGGNNIANGTFRRSGKEWHASRLDKNLPQINTDKNGSEKA
jgi:hypothetical protein